MEIGYARHMRRGLSIKFQTDMLIAAGIEERRIYRDETRDLTERAKGMRSLRRGDQMIVPSLASFAPNQADLLATVEALVGRGVKLRVLIPEPMTYSAETERFCRDLTDAKTTWKSENASDPTRKRQKRGGRPSKFGAPGSDKRAMLLALWKSDMTNTAFTQAAGVSERRAREIFGERPALKGRPVRKVK